MLALHAHKGRFDSMIGMLPTWEQVERHSVTKHMLSMARAAMQSKASLVTKFKVSNMKSTP